MKKRFIALIACIPIMLSACAEKAQESDAETISTSAAAQETMDAKSESKVLPLSIVHPTPDKMSDGLLDKLSINDAYILYTKDEYVLVIDYRFKSVVYDEPHSFNSVYKDSVYINGIEAKRYYQYFDDAEAQIDTKILRLNYANVKSGFVIKQSDIDSDKDCTVLVYWDRLKVYELSGKLSSLRIVEKGE